MSFGFAEMMGIMAALIIFSPLLEALPIPLGLFVAVGGVISTVLVFNRKEEK